MDIFSGAGLGISGEPFALDHDDGDFSSLLCRDCGSGANGAKRIVLFDGRAGGGSSCGGLFVGRSH